MTIAMGLALGLGATAAGALPVIPGASGFGMDTPAGRGGKVIKVTNLNASGPGSLKACIDASGPRVCVFEVSGTIRLNRDLRIEKPYLTIAGQTAPSPGITLRGAPLAVANTHDVLIQHLRIRVGDDANGAGGASPDNRDGLQIIAGKAPVKNVVVDHVSVSWGVDENFQLWHTGVSDITIRNSISSEALHDSIHPKGPHSMGIIVGPDIKRVTLTGNLFAHNNARNPRLKKGSETEFHNNVVYNWGNHALDTEGDANLVGNYFKKGADTRGSCVHERAPSALYMADNIGCGFTDSRSPTVRQSGYKPLAARDAYDYVLTYAGARPADRDSVDQRVVNDVKSGSGRIIGSQRQVGGWPSLAVNTRPLQLPANPNGDDNRDGYTNLEEWLHAYAREVEQGNAGPTIPKAPTDLQVDVLYP
ncbi:polysaccharide lyase family 1 protein [Alkalilimnicola sp. S0819]|uniref:pectate lyase family protein n=1 Tax=Alkalilimnicola sp. S0819 TaxID=2613922 RepID=UPI001261F49E|nr:right-handed parallel beta-helix repeat-containing protein [Alkalilimnicola sp. S0819]KAB7627884.1 right-handed parallel beta-helix repeat-containing protein [Alkalilimnicola sp. S0819]MPQ15520.1 right-handed parallel beta-helix repeat-containing protein [Alkalilimnicola sp. S0819]